MSISPHSMRQLSASLEMHDKDLFDTSFDDYTPNHLINESEEEYVTEDDLPDPAPSGRSSISSFPASIIHHNIIPSQTFSRSGAYTPLRSRSGTPTSHLPNQLSSRSTREYISGFRNPSSIRALQMRDEFSDEDLTPGHRRRGSRMSYMSYRSQSAHSTPGKRLSRSLQGSPTKSSKLKKEFPLVLLHCTMLSSTISPKAKTVSEELLEAVIPEPYKKRWKLLQEKVLGNFEVRERGVLISHPKEDYDSLEERLLESLELERPVLSNGHYVDRSESRASVADSGFGSEENSARGDTTDEEEELRCKDCGVAYCEKKRWEVKVYAANGLLKAGAWSAAWSEMEKVDIQVSVWLPEDVRLEVDSRLDAVIAQEQRLQAEELQGKEQIESDARTREIYGENTVQKKQEEIDGLIDNTTQLQISPQQKRPQVVRVSSHTSTRTPSEQVDLQTAFANYLRLLLQDQRNIAILLLCLLLGAYGMNYQPTRVINDTAVRPLGGEPHQTKTEYLTTTVVSTSTSIVLETSAVTKVAHMSSSSGSSARGLRPEGIASTADFGSLAPTTMDPMISHTTDETGNQLSPPTQLQLSTTFDELPLEMTYLESSSIARNTTPNMRHILIEYMEELGTCKQKDVGL